MIVEEQTRLSPFWGGSTVVSLRRLRPNKWANDNLNMEAKGVICKGCTAFERVHGEHHRTTWFGACMNRYSGWTVTLSLWVRL